MIFLGWKISYSRNIFDDEGIARVFLMSDRDLEYCGRKSFSMLNFINLNIQIDNLSMIIFLTIY